MRRVAVQRVAQLLQLLCQLPCEAQASPSVSKMHTSSTATQACNASFECMPAALTKRFHVAGQLWLQGVRGKKVYELGHAGEWHCPVKVCTPAKASGSLPAAWSSA